jgi:hypothetical protein
MHPQDATLYERLSAPFDYYPRVPIGGGGDAPYLTGEQVVTRLNDVLGPLGWSFTVIAHGLNAEADEFWCHGSLSIHFADHQPQTREQFGSQKVKRAKQSATPLDIGFDQKGAATDALKKCAAAFGVGLALSEKAPTQRQAPESSLDWTTFWSTLRGRGLSADNVTTLLGATPAALLATGVTLDTILKDPRLSHSV